MIKGPVYYRSIEDGQQLRTANNKFVTKEDVNRLLRIEECAQNTLKVTNRYLREGSHFTYDLLRDSLTNLQRALEGE